MKVTCLFTFFMSVLILSSPIVSYAQMDSLQSTEEEYHFQFDKTPQYPTGDYEMFEYLQRELLLEIPTFQLEKIYQNNYRSLVKVYIDTTGEILLAKLDHRSDDTYLHDEILDAFYKMPHWKPGEIDGNKVKSLVYVPVMITYYEKEQRYRDPQFSFSPSMFEVVYTPLFPDSTIFAKPVSKDATTKGILAAILITIATVLFIRYNPF